MFTQKKVKEEKSISTPLTLPVPPDVSIDGIYPTSERNKVLVIERKETRESYSYDHFIYDLDSLERQPTAIHHNSLITSVSLLPDGRFIYRSHEMYSQGRSDIFDPKINKVIIFKDFGLHHERAVNSEGVS